MLDDTEVGIQATHETPEFVEFMSDVYRNEAAITPEELNAMEAAEAIRITPDPMGYRAEVRYPGSEKWSYVGVYPTEHLARERAEDQLRTWREIQDEPMMPPEWHRQQILATVLEMRADVRAEIARVKRTA